MATPRSQRIGIWVIAVVMVLGTLGSFLAMVVGNQNQANDSKNIQKIYSDYQAKVTAQVNDLSDKYYDKFNQYSSIPSPFDAEGIDSVISKDLEIGDGDEIGKDTIYNAYYIGWNPKGIVFDQSIKNGALIYPISGSGLIPGWQEGVLGMKIGGIREITIPSEKAYGSTGGGENIPPNTPIKFIVLAIPKVEEVPIPKELLQQ